MKQQIDFLYSYNQWSNERMWLSIVELTDEQWCAEQHYSLGSVHDHIVHIMYATTRWTYTLRGFGKMPALEPQIFPKIVAAHNRWQELWEEINGYVFALAAQDLQQECQWGLPRRNISGRTPLWQLLHHLANHAMDHRTQVLMILHTQFGIQTPEQDIIFYMNEVA
ncbi:MAG: DinB family protein [Anaerolineaceae bacterium]|nr:DinB family protein [Anaerolineaceae bacterium]